MSRRHTGQNVHKIFKNIKILEFGDYIWNQHEKCIQISTNMPGVGSLIREIDVKIQKFEEESKIILLSKTSKTNARVLISIMCYYHVHFPTFLLYAKCQFIVRLFLSFECEVQVCKQLITVFAYVRHEYIVCMLSVYCYQLHTIDIDMSEIVYEKLDTHHFVFVLCIIFHGIIYLHNP